MKADIIVRGAVMRRTIDLPDELAARVDEYLRQHEGETLSSLVQQVLEREVVRSERPSIRELAGLADESPEEVARRWGIDLSAPAKNPDALLGMIGMVSVDTPRNVVPMEERQPEDRFTDRDI